MLLCLPMEAMAYTHSKDGYVLEGLEYIHTCGQKGEILNLYITGKYPDVSLNLLEFYLTAELKCADCGFQRRINSNAHTITVEYDCDEPTVNYFSIGNWVGNDNIRFKLTIPAMHLLVKKYDEFTHWTACGKCGEVKMDIDNHTMEAGDGYDYCILCDYRVYPEPVLPGTGDGANLSLWISLLAVSVIGMTALSRKRKSC